MSAPSAPREGEVLLTGSQVPAALLIRIIWRKLLLREGTAMQTRRRGRSLSCTLGEELSKAHLDFSGKLFVIIAGKESIPAYL